MSVSYSGDPSMSAIDRYRFALGDTNVDAPIMQDEELQFLIDQYGANENVLLYQMFLRAATLFARDIKRTLGPQSEDPTSRLSFFKSQANYYKAMCTAGGLNVPPSLYKPHIFTIDMQSNPPVRGPRHVR